jgi:hypothetical protein
MGGTQAASPTAARMRVIGADITTLDMDAIVLAANASLHRPGVGGPERGGTGGARSGSAQGPERAE